MKIRLLFCDPTKNKPMDVVHPLKLDPGKSGREVTGYEGYFDVELDKNSEFLPGEEGIEVDEVPRMSTVEHLEGESQEDSPAPEPVQDDITAAEVQEDTATGNAERPALVSSGSFSDESVVERVSDLDDTEIQQMVESLEPYAVQLHETVKKYPLVSEGVKLPYSVASSDAMFLSWNVGRQKSIEWHRARILQSEVLAELNGDESASQNLTVKNVVVWCRTHQYGPPTGDCEEDLLQYCRYCGMIKDAPLKKGRKRSNSGWGVDAYCRCGQDVVDHLTTMKTSSSVQDMINRNRQTTQNDTTNHTTSLTSTEIRALLYQTDANLMRWVWNTIDQLDLPGIQRTTDEITQPVEDTLAFSAVVTHATRSFLSRLIHLASQQSSTPTTEDEDAVAAAVVGASSIPGQNITAPLVVTPIHILRAIRAGREFDFLTNAGMATGSSQQ